MRLVDRARARLAFDVRRRRRDGHFRLLHELAIVPSQKVVDHAEHNEAHVVDLEPLGRDHAVGVFQNDEVVVAVLAEGFERDRTESREKDDDDVEEVDPRHDVVCGLLHARPAGRAEFDVDGDDDDDGARNLSKGEKRRIRMGPVNNNNAIYMFSMMFIERQEAVNKNNAM